MTNTKVTRKALLLSAMSLLLCISMLLGTTFAWFTDSVTSSGNRIISGILDVEVYHKSANVTEDHQSVTGATNLFTDKNGNAMLWEPGAVAYETFTVANVGTLAFKYNMTLNIYDYNQSSDGYDLRAPLKVKVLTGDDILTAIDRTTVQALDWTTAVSLEGFSRSGGNLYPVGNSQNYASEEQFQVVVWWEPTDADNNWNLNNERSGEDPLYINFGINVVATQLEHESDSFDNQYDHTSTYPSFPAVVIGSGSGNSINKVTENAVDTTSTEDVSITIKTGADEAIGNATVPNAAAVDLLDAATAAADTAAPATGTYVNDELTLTLNVDTKEKSDSSLTLDVTMDSLFVRQEGDDAASAVQTYSSTDSVKELSDAVTVTVSLEAGLSNVAVTHTHTDTNGTTVTPMTSVDSLSDLADGNFYYDAATGNLTLMTSRFSEFKIDYTRVNVVENATKNTTYGTFDAAMKEAAAGNDILLHGDVTGTVSKNVTVDLGGYNADLTVSENAAVQGDGNITAAVAAGKTLTVTGGAHESVDFTGDGNVVVTGGKYMDKEVAAYLAGGLYIPATPDSEGWYQVYADMEHAVATVNGYGFVELQSAIDYAPDGSTVTLQKNITESVVIKGAKGENDLFGAKALTLDLNGYTLTGDNASYAISLYDNTEKVEIKNGSVVNNGVVFRIGEHQRTIVKWKYADEVPMSGYHPLAPAKDIVLTNVNGTSTNGGVIFYYTNIEDDLTRANESNPFDQDLYGRYIYKTGYQTYEQSTYKEQHRDEVFTSCTSKDSVTIVGGEFTTAGNITGKMNDISGNLYTEVLTVASGTFSNDSIGRFVGSGKYLVGAAADHFIVQTSAPTDYTAKINNIYYGFAGGANAAILFANFGETVYIKENADAERIFSEDKNGNADKLTVVYEVEGVAYTGGVAKEPTYSMVSDDDGNSHTFYSKFEPVAAVYATARAGNWRTATKVGEYGTLKDAFAALSNDYTVVILKDFEVGDEMTYSYGGGNYKCAAGYASRSSIDFNGHMITYTGTGACILSSQSTGYLYIKDSVGGGGITATQKNAYCIRKENAKSDYSYISGGTFVSQNTTPVLLNGGTSITISGGNYITGGNRAVSKGWKVTTLSITGGTFSVAPDSSYIASGKTAVQNDNGTFTVK